MVMDQFVTTYRKDYLWPYVRTLGYKPANQYGPCVPRKEILCECHCLPGGQRPDDQRDVFGPKATKEQQWSRLGPMGPLLDPKLYPARVGPSPEADTNRFNQPNVFLHKLQEKYPFIYECLRTAPPDDIISRINRDRLRTTYQVDYGKMTEYPSAPYDELIRSAGVEGLPPCAEPIRLPGDPCRPNQRPVAFRPGTMSKIGMGDKAATGAEKKCATQIQLGGGGGSNPISSEYQDGISKLGQMIMKENLFARTKPK